MRRCFKGFNPKDHKIKQRINSLYITVLILNQKKKNEQVIDSQISIKQLLITNTILI